jgi:hypothetical protein
MLLPGEIGSFLSELQSAGIGNSESREPTGGILSNGGFLLKSGFHRTVAMPAIVREDYRPLID